MIKSKKWVLTLFILLALPAISMVMISNYTTNSHQDKSVKVASAQLEEVSDIIVAEGKTIPVEQINVDNVLSNITGAKVLRVNVDVGDKVSQGEVLAQLDQTHIANTLSQSLLEKDNAQTNFEDAKADRDRKEGLFVEGVITEQEIDQARLDFVNAKFRLESAKINLEMQKDQLAHTTIVAPIDGIVSARFVDTAETAGRVLFIINSSQVDFMAYVDEEKTGIVQKNQTAEVRLFAFPGQIFKGKITKINPAIEVDVQASGFPVWIQMSDSQSLSSGLSGYVKILTTRSVLTIPLTALLYFSGDRALVFVVEDSVVHLRPVVYGVTNNGKVEIIDGLEAGEQIVIDGLDKLEDGDKVRIVD